MKKRFGVTVVDVWDVESVFFSVDGFAEHADKNAAPAPALTVTSPSDFRKFLLLLNALIVFDLGF